ncbi:MAG: carboxymuconolactone decarboxylase family protein [Reyranellaceae bacterium]
MTRLAPLVPPYPPQAAAVLEQMGFGMPQPLALFRTIAHNPRVLDRIRLGGLLDKGSLTLRQRELMILRCCALCGAEYEWGVHVRIFQPHTGMSAAQVAATARPQPDAALWQEDERLILELADALHAAARVEEALYGRLQRAFDAAQLVELVVLAGFYHTISFVIGAFAIANEPEAPRFPATS